MLIELPCGIFHNDHVYDKVIVKEITGKQQNYLIDVELVSNNFGHVPKLLEDLTSDYQTSEGSPLDLPKKDIIAKLTTEDIEFLLLKIREVTYGENLGLPVVCPWCDKAQTKKIELPSLEIKKLADKRQRTKIVELPKSKLTAEVRLLYLNDLFELYSILSKKASTLYTATLAVSLVRLGDKTMILPEDLASLPITDLSLIEKAFSDLRGSVDTNIIHECDGCKKEFNTPLPIMDPSFFVPSRTPSI
jgi:hypothetical protein